MVSVVAVAAAACASGMRRGDATGPTLEIRNGGPAAVDLNVIQGVSVVGDTIGFSLGTLFAGRTQCFRLQPSSTMQWVKVRSAGWTLYTSSFVPVSRPAWFLDLTGNPQTDRLGLGPADEPCKPGPQAPSR